MALKENEFLTKTPDGRTWKVEVYGPGERCKVTDIMSPTGYHEWVSPQELGIKFYPAR